MTDARTRWVLAFDASCGTCQEISAAVSGVCGDRLEVLPLTHPDVEPRLPRAAAGKPEPTLLRIGGGDRTWTGPRMGVRLTRLLGVGTTARVLVALGRLRHRARNPLHEDTPGDLSRKRFLRLAGGAAVAFGIVAAGRVPAFAEQSCQAARAWVEANKDRLPTRYREIVDYPMVYRRAIYAELSPEARSAFWVEHLETYRAAHGPFTAAQEEVFSRARVLAGKLVDHTPSDKPNPEADRLWDAAVVAFGADEAAAFLARLGPTDGQTLHSVTPQASCSCYNNNDCSSRYTCRYRHDNCTFRIGCGPVGVYLCTGHCLLA